MSQDASNTITSVRPASVTISTHDLAKLIASCNRYLKHAGNWEWSAWDAWVKEFEPLVRVVELQTDAFLKATTGVNDAG